MPKNRQLTLHRRQLLLSALAAGTTLGTAFSASRVSAQDAPLVVGFSIWDLTIPFAVPFADELERAAKENNIDLRLVAAGWDASVQSQQLAEFVVQKVDVICATPVDVRGIVPAVHTAEAAGIPFVGCVGAVEGYPYLGADDRQFGVQMGNMILQALGTVAKPEDGYKVAFLRGVPGGSPDRLRYEGIMSVLSARDDIEVVAEVVTDWNPERALSGTQDILQKFGPGQIHLINGWGALLETSGARYAHMNGREDVLFTGGELTRQTKDAIERGWVYGVVIQDPATVGRVIAQALPEMAPDFRIIPASAAVELPLCTKDNLDQFEAF